MKTLIRLVCISLLVVSMTGCGSKTAKMLGQPTTTTTLKDGTVVSTESPLAKIAYQQAIAEERCMKAYEKSLEINCDGMDSRDCMVVKMQAQTARIVAVATGKDPNPCHNPDNLWAFMKTEVQETESTIRTGINKGAGVLTTGVITVGVVEATDTIGKSAGNTTTNNTEGGDATVNNTKTITETNTDTSVSNSGEEGTATTSSPSEGITIDEPVVVDDTVSSEPVTVTED